MGLLMRRPAETNVMSMRAQWATGASVRRGARRPGLDTVYSSVLRTSERPLDCATGPGWVDRRSTAPVEVLRPAVRREDVGVGHVTENPNVIAARTPPSPRDPPESPPRLYALRFNQMCGRALSCGYGIVNVRRSVGIPVTTVAENALASRRHRGRETSRVRSSGRVVCGPVVQELWRGRRHHHRIGRAAAALALRPRGPPR